MPVRSLAAVSAGHHCWRAGISWQGRLFRLQHRAAMPVSDIEQRLQAATSGSDSWQPAVRAVDKSSQPEQSTSQQHARLQTAAVINRICDRNKEPGKRSSRCLRHASGGDERSVGGASGQLDVLSFQSASLGAGRTTAVIGFVEFAVCLGHDTGPEVQKVSGWRVPGEKETPESANGQWYRANRHPETQTPVRRSEFLFSWFFRSIRPVCGRLESGNQPSDWFYRGGGNGRCSRIRSQFAAGVIAVFRLR